MQLFFLSLGNFLLGPLLRFLGYLKNSGENQQLPESADYSGQKALHSLIALHRQFLTATGWLESVSEKKALRNGEWIPWLTYPAVSFLDALHLEGTKVLEFGAGASTLYFDRRKCKVVSIETDEGWHERLKSLPLESTEVFTIPHLAFSDDAMPEPKLRTNGNLTESFARAFDIQADKALTLVERLADLVCWADVVLVDGGPRELWVDLIVSLPDSPGVVIVDNADIDALANSVESLLRAGYLRLPFVGLSPMNPYQGDTSFFFMEDSLNRLLER